MDDLNRYASQIGQDAFVDQWLRKKRHGTFLDVGCGHHERISNTWFLETYRGWSGIGIDNNPSFRAGWDEHRPRSVFVCADATKVKYGSLTLPLKIDYLSVDLEPPQLSLAALRKILDSPLRFRVITFETDWYRQKETRDPSRELLSAAGYTLHTKGNQDDFWVENS